MSSIQTTRKTRSTTVSVLPSPTDEPAQLDDLRKCLQSPIQFISLYNQCYPLSNHRSALIDTLCHILADSTHVDAQILLFILDSLTSSAESLLSDLSDLQFKQDLLPFIKQSLATADDDANEIILSSLRFLTALIEHRSSLLTSTLAEWLSTILHFVVTRISTSSYEIYGDATIDLLRQVAKQFTPLPKEIVDVLGRSPSSIISTNFLSQLKDWVKHVEDARLALFAIHLWEPLAALLSRLLTRGHTKGNEMLAVMQDAFVVANYAIRGAAFSAWSSFMSHIYRSDFNMTQDDLHQQQLYNRLLKLFLTPFLPDNTSKSKSASIAKCRAWLVLVAAYPTHVDDVLLPFLAFAFGTHTSSKTGSTTTAWWPECRQIGAQYLHDTLPDQVHGAAAIRAAGSPILDYLFDSIVDELLEHAVSSPTNDEKSRWLTSWHAFVTHLTNNALSDEQRAAINACLLTRIEQLWIDSRLPTRSLLHLFDAFEQTGFPLAIETVLRDSSIRTKTLSATQNNRSQDKSSTLDPSLTRTSLSDQYLHMMLEHAIRYNDDDPAIEDAYLHVISYLIDTLAKTSDDNFAQQTSSLLAKCSVELAPQPLTIPSLFWHIWSRCSTHIIQILNRARSLEFHHQSTNQRQETAIELLLRPFSIADAQRLDYSHTLTWTQLFKALCRLALIDQQQSTEAMLYLYVQLLRHGPVFQQAINDQHYQRLFGFLLATLKILLKTFSEIDLTATVDRSAMMQKRSLPSITLCFTQLSMIVNGIVQRVLSNDENNTQWVLVGSCLSKSSKTPSNAQAKSLVFVYVRDLVVDLFNLCKTSSHLEILLLQSTQLVAFLENYEQCLVATPALTIAANKQQQQQQTDSSILNKIIAIVHLVFDSTASSSLLQPLSPVLILALQHPKAAVRNKARKCWNETFGRSTFIVYPNELRACLRDLKEKEHLLLPCFLADHENSNTAGSGMMMPSGTDESQLSQQVDIVTPLVLPTIQLQRSTPSSPARFSSPSIRPAVSERTEPVFVPITNKISHDNHSDSPVLIGKRMSSTSTGLTEKQKERLRARHAIPLLCDDNSNTQSLAYTMDTPTIESMMATYHLGSQPSNASVAVQENNPPAEPLSTSMETNDPSSAKSDENTSEPPADHPSNEEEIPEESSMTKKLRRSRRPSTSARKSFTNNSRKKRSLPASTDLTTTTTLVPSIVIDPAPASSTEEAEKRGPLKGILKRLSPSTPRSEHRRHVAFHDQVKVLLFASPSRRDLNLQQQRKKSPNRDELASSSQVTRRSSNTHPDAPGTILIHPKTRSSKLFTLPNSTKPETNSSLNNSSTAESQTKPAEPIFPALIDCDKPLDSLIHVLYGGVCPTNAINYFRSIKMRTVGDIARSTADQIDVYPIPPPKLANVQKALALYQDRLVTSPSLSPILGINGESLTPIASTSEEPIAITDGTFTKESSSFPSTTTTAVAPVADPHHPLYDVDTLIDSLDYERLYLHETKELEAPSSTSQPEFIRTRRQAALANRNEQISPLKRPLSPTHDVTESLSQHDEDISPKKPTIDRTTLGDRLQKAADAFKTHGHLTFDDDYIELVRQLFHNSSLTHLEQLHLKSLFLDQ